MARLVCYKLESPRSAADQLVAATTSLKLGYSYRRSLSTAKRFFFIICGVMAES